MRAFGLLFFRMLTGRAYAGEPPTKFEPQLPHVIDDYVAKCVHADPIQRFENGESARQGLTEVARAHGLPRPLEAVEAPRPDRRVTWPEGVAVCGSRVLACGLFIGLPWVLGGLALALPELGRTPYAWTLSWLVLAVLFDLRVPGDEPAQAKLGRLATGVFVIVMAFGQFGAYPTTLKDLTSPLYLTLMAAAAIVAGPACVAWIREPLAQSDTGGLRVRFQGQAGTRASVDGEPDSDLPFELDLPPGGHEVAVRQATGTVTFILRLPAADYLVVEIPAVRLLGRFPTMAEERPPPESAFSPAGALASAALALGPLLALLVGGGGLLLNPGSRVASLEWPGARPEPAYHAPVPPANDAQWKSLARTSLTRLEQKAYQLVSEAERKPAKALELFTQSFGVVPTTRAALGAAEAAARAGKVDLARGWLAKVADEDLTNVKVIERAANVAFAIGDTDAGLGLFASALSHQPADEDLRARYVVAQVRAKRLQGAQATLLADDPNAGRLLRALELLHAEKLSLAPVIEVVERLVKDPKQRTAGMPDALLAFTESLTGEDAADACRLIKALLATGLRHPRLAAEAKRSCR